jgi:hypothetical protein
MESRLDAGLKPNAYKRLDLGLLTAALDAGRLVEGVPGRICEF